MFYLRSILFLLFPLVAFRSVSQSNIAAAGKRIDTLHSKILNEDRFLWIHVPASAKKDAAKKFPVLFLFDAEANFDETNNIISKINSEPGNKTALEMIVVGIGNIWLRYRDYSPTHVSSSPWVDEATAKTTGGGDTFISFIEKELLPYLSSNYPVSSTRLLIGHSMGGLQVMNILLKHPGLFDYYAAIDPSMWWDDKKLLNESAIILGNKTFEKKTLFLAIANTMNKDMDIQQIKKDTGAKTVLIRPSLTLADYLETNKQNKLNFKWKFYKDHQHMTVNTPATRDALRFFMESF